MDMLVGKKCAPCEGGVKPMTPEQYSNYLPQVPEWKVEGDYAIIREMKFKDFKAAMAFLNKVADLAEAEGHHPDFTLHGWNKVRFGLSTHAIGGLSINDFIMAAKIDTLYAA